MAITIKRINELPAGTPANDSPVMFGINNDIFRINYGDLKQLINQNEIDDLTYTVLEENITFVADGQLTNNPLSGISLNVNPGRLYFIRFNVFENNVLGRDTYLIPLPAGNYPNLANELTHSSLIRIDRKATIVDEGDANTVTYSVADLNEINTASPAFDFTNTDFIYFVNLDGVLYRFDGTNDLYGSGELQMQMTDLEAISTDGGDDITVDSNFSDTSTNPLENQKVSTLRNFTTVQSANITATDLKALSNQHVICDTDLTIDVDDTFQDSFNVNISVEYGKTVTINATSPATINNSTLTQGVYFLSKVKGTNNFKIKVIRRDFEILQHTGNTFDVDTKAGKIFYEKYGSYFSNPKSENPIKLNIGEPGSWAIINSNTTNKPFIVNNTDSRPIRYLAGGNQWSEDELSDSTIDIVIQVLPFEIRVSYKLIST